MMEIYDFQRNLYVLKGESNASSLTVDHSSF